LIYKDIFWNNAGTEQKFLEQYHSLMDMFTRGAKDFLCAWANALKQ
jgi:hypothetical protein